MSIFSKQWWENRKTKKQLQLKRDALHKLNWAMVSDSPKDKKAACKAILRALRAGVDLNPNDPIWAALKYADMQRIMDQVCTEKKYKYTKLAKWGLIVGGAALIGTGVGVAVLAALGAEISVAGILGGVFAKLGMGVIGAKAIGAVLAATGIGACFGGVQIIQGHSTEYNRDLWASFWGKVQRNGGNKNGQIADKESDEHTHGSDQNLLKTPAPGMQEDLYKGEQTTLVRDSALGRIRNGRRKNLLRNWALTCHKEKHNKAA